MSMVGMVVPEVPSLQLEVLENPSVPWRSCRMTWGPWHLQISLVVSFLCLVHTPHIYILLTFYSLMGLSSLRKFMLQGGSWTRRTAPLGALFLEASVERRWTMHGKSQQSQTVLGEIWCVLCDKAATFFSAHGSSLR